MNVTDLTDPEAVAGYLDHIGRDVELDDAHALAEHALDLDAPPAGAWTVLAHVAEHRGDYAGLERWTAAALGADPTFGPSVDDDIYLDDLRRGAHRRGSAALRGERLLRKLDHFSGRVPQLRAQLDLVGVVLGREIPEPTVEGLLVADSWQFAGHLAFEAGLLRTFDAVAGALLPPAERALLQSWFDVRHRHVRMISQSRRLWKLADVTTGEVLVADTIVDVRWPTGREGFLLVAPVGRSHAIVGEPIIFGERQYAEARAAVSALADDPLAVARTALRWRLAADLVTIERDRAERIRFVFPDLDPDDVDPSEEAQLELVESRMPDAPKYLQVLHAIVAERIITLRRPETWALAEQLLAEGVGRDDALVAVIDATEDELWERYGIAA